MENVESDSQPPKKPRRAEQLDLDVRFGEYAANRFKAYHSMAVSDSF